MGSELYESSLGEVDRDVAIVMVQPHEGGPQDIIHVLNEIKDDLFCKLTFKQLLFFRINGVKYVVINVYANVDGIARRLEGRHGADDGSNAGGININVLGDDDTIK